MDIEYEHLGVRLPKQTKQALREAAEADKRTVTSLIEKIVDDWLKEKGFLK